jgi:hypothetical protein
MCNFFNKQRLFLYSVLVSHFSVLCEIGNKSSNKININLNLISYPNLKHTLIQETQENKIEIKTKF